MATQYDSGMDEAAAAFGNLGPIDESPLDQRKRDDEPDGTDDPVDPDDEEVDTSAQSGDELEEPGEGQDEPEIPAIEPPTSWDAEAKKLFAGLPPEAQRVIADRENQRDKAVNAKASEAAAARKASEAAANEAAQIAQHYADQLNQYTRAIEPQRPDYSLLATDPQAYAQQAAAYEAATAQRNELAQHAEQASRQAQALQQQQMKAASEEFHSTLTQAWGEKWSDPKQRETTIAELTPIAEALGYAPEVQSEANATDLLALRVAADWKAKADKWDKAIASNMEKVRGAKLTPKTQTPGVAQPKGSEQRRGFNDSMTQLKRTGDVRDAAAAFAKLG